MSVKQKKHWHQDTPRMQLVALVQAAQGHMMNVEDGPHFINPIDQAKKALKFLDEVQEILRQMPEGEWK